MLNYLQMLETGERVTLCIVALLALAELIKAGTTVWSFFAAKYLGVKNKYTERQYLDNLTVENKKRLDDYVKKQDEFNDRFQKDLEDIKDVVKDTSDLVLNTRIESMRSTILDFASSVASGRVYTKEQFRYVKKVHRDYEALIKERDLTNDEVDISFKIIERMFEYNVLNNRFIEDKLSDPNFQKEIREELKAKKKKKEAKEKEVREREVKETDIDD